MCRREVLRDEGSPGAAEVVDAVRPILPLGCVISVDDAYPLSHAAAAPARLAEAGVGEVEFSVWGPLLCRYQVDASPMTLAVVLRQGEG